MKSLFAITAITILASATLAGETTLQRMTAVEQGLRPAFSIEGDPTWSLYERMEHYGVPGVGIAVVDDFKVVWYRTYGLADRELGARAVPTTLFQAGSVSKPVAAFGAMLMVADGRLDLESDVNTRLTSWALPDNEFTAQQIVNLRHLLSHTGGVTVHGFPGYAVGDPVPSLVQVLDGIDPANTGPIRVDQVPGTNWRYSGGGYTIVQQMMIDASGQTFPELMHDLVLAPLGMTQSTFENPLSADRLAHAAAGVLPDGVAVEGKRHTYPEMAAAGLWTTAEDLALLAVEVQHALRGEGRQMSRETAHLMLDPVDGGYALGWGIDQRGEATYFQHGGWDEGFCAQLTAHRDAGYGVAVMINSNHPQFLAEVVNAVAHEYEWAGYEVYEPQPVPVAFLASAPGRYRYNAELAVRVYREDDRLFLRYAGDEPEELLHVGDDRFMRRGRTAAIVFATVDGEVALNFVLGSGGFQTHVRLADNERLPREYLAEGLYYAALAKYRALLESDPDEPAVSEEYLNDRGLNLLETDAEQAFALLRIATDLYPDSANTWDSLGYAYRQAGDLDNARRYYRRALSKDPEFDSAREALAELGSSE